MPLRRPRSAPSLRHAKLPVPALPPALALLALLARALLALLALLAPGCQRAPAALSDATVTISIVGTNDVHGRVGRVALIGGYVDNLRQARAADGGAVVLLDGGDIFQGTLESNMSEGVPMVLAYNALGYDAAAVGNHEFDYGPVGPDAMPTSESQDPRGALLARASEMDFPLLLSNVRYRNGDAIDWPGISPAVMLDANATAGVSIGIVGATTEEALESTLAGNVTDLEMLPAAETIIRYATALRGEGAQIVLVTIHAGAGCDDFHEPRDATSCSGDLEVFELARALPAGLVDGNRRRAYA